MVKVGETYGYLTVISDPFKQMVGKEHRWCVNCKCVCGKEKIVREYSLRSGNTVSCSCKKGRYSKAPRQKGQTNGWWTLLSNTRKEKIGNHFQTIVDVQCVCGVIKTVQFSSIANNKSLSCGCRMSLIAKKKFTKHGEHATKLYSCWESMKRRCLNNKSKSYHNYGGRGISICNEWLQYEPFRDWAVNNGYEEGLTLDRVDVHGNYHPDNCEWVTRQENSRRQTANRDKKITELSNEVARLSKLLEDNNIAF